MFAQFFAVHNEHSNVAAAAQDAQSNRAQCSLEVYDKVTFVLTLRTIVVYTRPMYRIEKQSKVARRTAAALSCLLLLISGFIPLSSARAESAEIQTAQVGTITAECTFALPEELAGKEYRFTDGLVESYQMFSSGQTLEVDLPDGVQGIYLEWYAPTSRYTLKQLDASGATLSEDAASPYLNAYYPLNEATKHVTLAFSGAASLSTFAAYGVGDLPATVQRWNTPADADLLVVASSPKTALDEFFGVIAN